MSSVENLENKEMHVEERMKKKKDKEEEGCEI